MMINLSKIIPPSVNPTIRNDESNMFSIVKEYGSTNSTYVNLVPETLLLYNDRRTIYIRSTADTTLLYHGTFMCQVMCIIDFI